jgi:NAD(P)-dependent dehydrogenase (short-subunit alcohol dehydrogenase family)
LRRCAFFKQQVSVKLEHYWELEYVRTRFTEFRRRVQELEKADDSELARFEFKLRSEARSRSHRLNSPATDLCHACSSLHCYNAPPAPTGGSMFQSGLLRDRAIFLTGGGSGLGRSMALHFARLGARVFLVGRREEPLKETCSEIHQNGGAAAFLSCDVRDSNAVDAAFTAAENHFGEIDSLVNNAAGNFMARTEKLSPNAFHAVVGIVLYGTFNCTQAFARRRIAKKLGGNILNITTTYAAANCGSGYVVPSACAKAGVLALTTSLAVEWAKYHIRVNAIAPGPFPTEGAWSRLIPSKQFEDHAINKHPMRRFGKHGELSNLAVFLLSDMSEYINGECVVIDGAQWLRGAGEFNDLGMLPEAVWEQLESARPKKESS